MVTTNETRQESRVRSLARRRGYVVRKSRQWKNVPNVDNCGAYRLIDTEINGIVLGSRYDATLDDIEQWLTEP
jgi:hypothetical protein